MATPLSWPISALSRLQAAQGRGTADLPRMGYLATLCPSWADQIRLLDATPIPCGTSRATTQRSELAVWANYGYCAAHSLGIEAVSAHHRDGIPVAWCLADPKLGESEVTEDLLGHAHDIGALRPVLIILGDKGISNLALDARIGDPYHVLMARPDRITAKRRRPVTRFVRGPIPTSKREGCVNG